jgi:predicted amino acid dehydrogenase
VTLGERGFDRREAREVELTIAERSSRGTLTVQCALRGHSASRANPGVEIIGATSLDLDGAQGSVTAQFAPPLIARGEFYQMALEVALVWRGESPLYLAGPPTVL